MNYKPIWDGRSSYGGKGRRHIFRRVVLALVLLGVVSFAALEGLVLALSGGQVTGQPQVMVIVGCQVKPSGPSMTLQDRLDTALEYLESHPDMTVVVSGGQGQDEPTSEARCMYDYLTARGVDGAHILLEEGSFNTWQNVSNSIELLRQEGMETDNALVVSSGFHLARVRLLWPRAGGGDVSTLGAPVRHTPTAVHMFFREPAALVKSFLLDR